tara:strand:+ start:509 stop:1249 length:741 start_codon:yes stop_codon:yes gene_type:complete
MRNLTGTLCLTLAVLFGSAGVSASADFRKGLTAYKSGDYATALREWKPLAEQGHFRAQFGLGLMYYHGRGVPKDGETAVKWYRVSAEQGYRYAKYNLAQMYEKGWGVAQDYKTAMKWYTLAAEQGYAPAQNNLGRMYRDGLGVPQDGKTAVEWFKLAAEQGNAGAQNNLNKLEDQIAAKKPSLPSKSAAEKENERLREEIARLKGKPETPSLTDSSNMQEAKKECSELGFKTGTEKFGECVLQLTE